MRMTPATPRQPGTLCLCRGGGARAPNSTLATAVRPRRGCALCKAGQPCSVAAARYAGARSRSDAARCSRTRQTSADSPVQRTACLNVTARKISEVQPRWLPFPARIDGSVFCSACTRALARSVPTPCCVEVSTRSFCSRAEISLHSAEERSCVEG